MSINVRSATIEDLFTVSQLFSKYLTHHKQDHNLADCILFIEKRILSGDSQIFVLENTLEKKILGFTQLYSQINSFAQKKVWNLSDIYIDTPYRRAGLGKLLLKECEVFSQASGSHGLILKIDHTDPVAQALYEAMGWKREDEHTYILDQNSKNQYTVMLPF